MTCLIDVLYMHILFPTCMYRPSMYCTFCSHNGAAAMDNIDLARRAYYLVHVKKKSVMMMTMSMVQA